MLSKINQSEKDKYCMIPPNCLNELNSQKQRVEWRFPRAGQEREVESCYLRGVTFQLFKWNKFWR